MIVWSGFGFLAPLLVAAIAFGTQLGAEAIQGRKHLWPLAAGLLISAIPLWFLGKYFNRHAGKEFVHPATGEKFIGKSRHTLYWIPMHYWAIPVAIGGAIFLYSELARLR